MLNIGKIYWDNIFLTKQSSLIEKKFCHFSQCEVEEIYKLFSNSIVEVGRPLWEKCYLWLMELRIFSIASDVQMQIKLTDACKAWMKNLELLQNCSTGFHFPSPPEKKNLGLQILRTTSFNNSTYFLK